MRVHHSKIRKAAPCVAEAARLELLTAPEQPRAVRAEDSPRLGHSPAAGTASGRTLHSPPSTSTAGHLMHADISNDPRAVLPAVTVLAWPPAQRPSAATTANGPPGKPVNGVGGRDTVCCGRSAPTAHRNDLDAESPREMLCQRGNMHVWDVAPCYTPHAWTLGVTVPSPATSPDFYTLTCSAA